MAEVRLPVVPGGAAGAAPGSAGEPAGDVARRVPGALVDAPGRGVGAPIHPGAEPEHLPAHLRGPVTLDPGDCAEYPAGGLWDALREVLDPEMPISVVDLGLVVHVAREDGKAVVDMTFTATACPCMDLIKMDVRDRLLEEPGVEDVEIREVWEPAWTRTRMTAEGRATLRRFGVAA